MKTQSVVNVRLAENKERLLLNFVFSLWFEKELEKVNAGTDSKKKARYAKLKPFEMVVEPPVVFKADYFLSCATDRPAGTLLVDKPVPYLTLETFLAKSSPSPNVSEGGNVNQTLLTAVKEKTVTLTLLRELLNSEENLSTDPIFYLTKLYDDPDNEGDYVVIYDGNSEEIDFDALVSWVFRDYTFESIEVETMEKGDDNYPTKRPSVSRPDSFYTGTVKVTDSTFKEKSLTFKFIDLKFLADLVASIEDIVIVNVDTAEVVPTDPTAENITVGKGTVITTSESVSNDDLVLAKVVDDLGRDITEKSQLVVTDNAKTTLTTEINVNDFDFAFAFRYGGNKERRRINATFDIKEQSSAKTDVTIPVDYTLAAESITPVVEYFDTRKGMGKSVLNVSFLDKDGNPIQYVVPQDLGKGYKMFDTSSSTVSFTGTKTRLAVENGETLQHILQLDVQLSRYGSVIFDFVDPALSRQTYDVVDPYVDYAVSLIEERYEGGKLTLDYNVLQNNRVLNAETKTFTKTGVPTLTIGDKTLTPTTTWNKQGFVNVYDVGKLTEDFTVTLKGEISIGANHVNKTFSHPVTLNGEPGLPDDVAITQLQLNGGIIYPGPDKITENVLSGSVLVVSPANTLTPDDLTLVSLTDTLGNTITDKAQVIFTALNDDRTQFSPTITLNGYAWPMSFDNQGENGKLKATFQIADKTNTAVSGETTYKFGWNPESLGVNVWGITLKDKGLENASLHAMIYDIANSYNPFETGYPQTLPTQPPLFATDDVVYTGAEITYGSDTPNDYGPYIPVNLKQYGDFTLSFSDPAFKSVKTSVADPNATYALTYDNRTFTDDGRLVVEFQLTKDGAPFKIYNGRVVDNSITYLVDGQRPDGSAITWRADADADSAYLSFYIPFSAEMDKEHYQLTISGTWYIGVNRVPITVNYDSNAPAA